MFNREKRQGGNALPFFLKILIIMARKRSGRKAARKQKRQIRQTARASKQQKRVLGRVARQQQRVDLRQKRKGQRIMARDARKVARLSKKQVKRLERIYGDMSAEDINALNEIEPYMPEMVAELEDAGIELNDPQDEVEVATRYVAAQDPEYAEEHEEEIDEAYIYDDEDEDYLEHAEKEKKRKKNLGKIAGFLGETAARAVGYFAPETRGTAAGQFKRSYTKQTAADFLGGNTMLLVAAVLVAAFLIFRK